MIYDWMSNIEFAWPVAFALWIAIPILIWRYGSKQAKEGHITVSTVHFFQTTSWKNWFRHVPFIFRLIAVLLLVFAIARPQRRNDETITKGEGIDIVLSIDVSGSMLSKDFLPNRLEAAKEVAADFVRSRPVDRIGLVIFSGESFTQTPITTDRQSLLGQIAGLRSGLLQDGTLIGEGLATAVDRLSKSTGKSKVVILLTDGKEEPPENRLIDPLTALEIAKAQNVKVYTIGMALEGYQAVEEKMRSGIIRQRVKIFLDEELLTKIANETGGQYYRARDIAGLRDIYKRIDELEKSEVEIISRKKYKEEFLPFVLGALILLFLELVLKYTLLKKFP
jgi:Ca-activated chloride channel family protein